MIANGLKKLAKEYGMIVSNGVAYGSLGGYAATMCEGSGWKRIVFSTRFTDPSCRTGFMDAMNERNLKKDFRVLNLGISAQMIQIDFHDTIGTMGKIRTFLEWILPIMQHYGATGAHICPHCGIPVEGGRWAMVNGVAHHLHDACAMSLRQEVEASNEQRSQEDTGNYFTGFLGAMAGSVIGAVAWAIVLSLGYIASIVGLLIGFLSQKGYDLCRGKQGKAKVLILIFAIIIGVLLGNIGAEVITVVSLMNSGDLPGLVAGDIPWLILTVFVDDAEYRGAVIKNILIGILFAGIGVFALLRQTGKNVSGNKYIAL